MTFKQKKLITMIAIFALMFGIYPVANAMHIMEGYLSPTYCLVWGAISLPFIIAGYLSIKKKVEINRSSIAMFAMAGAFIFILSSLKIPSVTGSSSHMTGTGLGAILFGPLPISILAMIVLLFQAILLAHGGLTTLGANTFSMGVAGPFVTFGLYMLGKKLKLNKYVTIFIAAAVGDLFTYLVTSFQLGLAYPSEVGGVLASVPKFLVVFAPTQVPLAIIEGILTVVIIIALEAYASAELAGIGYLKAGEAR